MKWRRMHRVHGDPNLLLKGLVYTEDSPPLSVPAVVFEACGGDNISRCKFTTRRYTSISAARELIASRLVVRIHWYKRYRRALFVAHDPKINRRSMAYAKEPYPPMLYLNNPVECKYIRVVWQYYCVDMICVPTDCRTSVFHFRSERLVGDI